MVPSGSHVGYFASGSQLLQLIYDFPEATHYHLFDILDYWAYDVSPAYLLREINQAEVLLNSGKPPEVIQRGFLDHVPAEVLDPQRWRYDRDREWFRRNLPGNPALARPFVVRVDIPVEGKRTVEKRIYLHAVNQTDPWQVHNALAGIQGGLRGIIMDMMPSDNGTVDEIVEGLRLFGGVFKIDAHLDSRGIYVQRWGISGRMRRTTILETRNEIQATEVSTFDGALDDEKILVFKF